MGNCVPKSHKSTAEIAPFDCIKPSPVNATVAATAAVTSSISSSAGAPTASALSSCISSSEGAATSATASSAVPSCISSSTGPAAAAAVSPGASDLADTKATATVARGPATSTVRLYGPPKSLVTSYIRFALLHKRATVRFIPSESEKLSLQIGSDALSGSREALLRFIEEKFPEPRLMMGKFNLEGFDETTPLIMRATWLQHRSLVWHLARMLRWAEDLAARGGRRAVDPAAGTPRMELRKFVNSYSQLQELMLEHAQMEERILFPVLESVDRGICKSANEEHGRELPMMNGIKEDIKSIGVLDSGTPACQEALSNLAARFKSLQDRCEEHFQEEERDLLPLVEAAERSREQHKRLLNQSLDVMKGTHSRLFDFFLEGLLPQEAMQYLDLIMKHGDGEQISSMLLPVHQV